MNDEHFFRVQRPGGNARTANMGFALVIILFSSYNLKLKMLKVKTLFLAGGVSIMTFFPTNPSVGNTTCKSGTGISVNFQKQLVNIPYLVIIPADRDEIQNDVPKDGTYTYSIAFEESEGSESLGVTCTIVIRGDSITVINNGHERMKGKKGDVIEQGIIMKHQSGKWIIGHNTKDINATEVGWCANGPKVIDFKRKIFFVC